MSVTFTVSIPIEINLRYIPFLGDIASPSTVSRGTYRLLTEVALTIHSVIELAKNIVVAEYLTLR